MTLQMIPLNQLVPSAANVRKTGAAAGIDELAASIAAHGLLQNLQVRPAAKGKFEVVAGGRRLAALRLLVKDKRMDKDADISCHVIGDADAGEISLAENTLRQPMHPADQFEAFHALSERGKGIEDIAARFGVSVAVVRQRLKLASVSPRLIQLYREEELSLDQLMAFTITDDIAAQEAVWFEALGWQREPNAIRRALTASQVEADDRRVQFVGLDAYREAGGNIARDLFRPEHEGYLTDVALLDRLVRDRLETAAATVKAEGWRWVQVMPGFDYAERQMFKRIPPAPTDLSPDAQAERDRLMEAYDALAEQAEEEDSDEIDAQLDALSAQIEALEANATSWSPTDMALSGAVIALDRDGSLTVERGLVRIEDAKRIFAARDNEAAVEPVKASGLSSVLVADLTAERTAALRAVLMSNSRIALAALAHGLALGVLYRREAVAQSCLDIELTSRDLVSCGREVGASEAAQRLAAQHRAWLARLPEDAADLFAWLLAQPEAVVIDLLAFCAAQGVDAVQAKHDHAEAPRLHHADQLAEALGLDMAQWWQPTADRYLGRVPKALLLEALREGVSPQIAHSLAALKKDQLVIRAEERLKGKGWLPSILRRTDTPAEVEAEKLAA